MPKRTAKTAKLDEDDASSTTTTTTTTTTTSTASAAGGSDFPSDLVSLGKLRVSDLKEKLEELGLDGSGKKMELVARLFDHLNGSSGSTDSTGTADAKSKKARVEDPQPEEQEASSRPKRGGKKAAAAAATPAVEEEKKIAADATPMNVEEKKPQKASEILAAAAAAKKAAGKGKGKAKVDQYVPNSSKWEVYEDYDCMLNQTNSGNNNNKYYVIQVLVQGSTYATFNRWGRVGEPGQNAFKAFGSSVKSAIDDFEKKFKDKTSNAWANRANFSPRDGKYTMIEMDYDEEDDDSTKLAALSKLAGDIVKRAPKVRACKLDKSLQELLKLLFDHDMFKNAMASFNIDVNKMPLGKISVSQIAKGYGVLEQIQDEIDAGASGSTLAKLSDTFFTLIPHSFGRSRPPVINTKEAIQAKMDMLNVLGDIEIAQSLLSGKEAAESAADVEEVDDPLTANYKLLNTRLEPVDKSSATYKLIETYTANTANTSWRKPKILDVFEVAREGEDKRFDAHKAIANRKLLWHGTNVAVVVAILKSGLRIMPHSGGRVGKGIYFADMNEKSAGYVGTTSNNIGIMFLNEVALGKEHSITKDDSSLRNPPSGYDSVVARGRIMPDPSKDTTISIDGNSITVPQGTSVNTSYSNSSFQHSEYLVYKENQCRIRYLLKIRFD